MTSDFQTVLPEVIIAVGSVQPRRRTEVAGQLLASVLEVKVQPGDRVAMWAPNCAEWVIACSGIHRVGAVLDLPDGLVHLHGRGPLGQLRQRRGQEVGRYVHRHIAPGPQ